jgi:hypothetical protein
MWAIEFVKLLRNAEQVFVESGRAEMRLFGGQESGDDVSWMWQGPQRLREDLKSG